MKLNKCTSADFDRITEYYKFVIDNTLGMKTYCPWIYGKHPTDEMIKNYIDSGYMYFFEDNSQIVAAAVLTPFQDEDYSSVNWSVSLKADEVSVIHLLCVNPKYQGRGISKKLIESLIDIAKRDSKKGIRLDALYTNTRAHSLYEGMGFKKCDVKNWYAGNTGWTDFYLFEYYFI